MILDLSVHKQGGSDSTLRTRNVTDSNPKKSYSENLYESQRSTY